MSESTYRALTDAQITSLEAAGSSADDWKNVTVTEGFDPSRVARCAFSGNVKLGSFRSNVMLEGGACRPAGVYDSTLHAVTVDDDALVLRGGLVANYQIGAGAVVCDVGRLVVEGESSFGNGTKIEVLNEGGGRDLVIYDRLNAQIAYLLVCYRHRPKLIEALEGMIASRVTSLTSSTGSVGAGARIMRTTAIVNVRIGEAATIDGALQLTDGTIASTTDAPVAIGAGVSASGFIIQSGSKIDGGAMLAHCFVGQACKIGRQYSAENSAFFANCEGFHGEACSVFAGPYTVTHHKSTLLIAGMLSFYNAGSGTNQSNHMYKLGPLHQGILERGSKTGSFSYLLWPARVGAFTAVLGKHYANFDTSAFPFSYIDEVEGRSVLTPAMNLFTVGTRRDGDKWPARDRRKGEKLDRIIFDVLSPYTVAGMIRGAALAATLYAEADRSLEFVRHNAIQIKRLMLRTTKKYYEMGIKRYLCGEIARRLEGGASPAEALSSPADTTGEGEWTDVLGLLAPKSTVEGLCDSVESGATGDIDALEAALAAIHEAYGNSAWAWTVAAWRARAGKAPGEMSNEELAAAVKDWRDSTVKLNNMILADAKKEFDVATKTGFGVDGGDAVRDADFEAVRGTFEGNSFVRSLQDENATVQATAEKMIATLGG